jgi:DNA polymerase III alpha subunit
MKYDQHGTVYATEDDVFDLLHAKPGLDISGFRLTDPSRFNQAVSQLFADLPQLEKYQPLDQDLEQFDRVQQQHWHMPTEYASMDIAKWVLEQCSTQEELQRCGEELMMFQERHAFDLLRYMKYLVDLFRDKGVIWGVGRGSSVASFVLYKIGIHRINSLHYDLDPREFLK